MRWTMLAALTLLTACQNDPAGLAGAIAGSWDWTQSSGGIAGWQLTPESEGYNVRIEIAQDGVVHAFRNDSLIDTSHATWMERLVLGAPGAAREYEVTFSPPLRVFTFATMESHIVRTPDADTIVLEDPCCDQYTHTFEGRPASAQ